jgi:hypothetical protein
MSIASNVQQIGYKNIQLADKEVTMAKIVMCILVVVKESRASKHNSLWLDSY